MKREWQKTLARPLSLSGQGIHSGLPCQLTLCPAKANTGVQFLRTDLKNAQEILARVDFLGQDHMRRTVLQDPNRPENRIETAEHILAALLAFGITNVRVECTAAEMPIWDGSAMEIARALSQAEIENQEGCPIAPFVVEEPFSFSPENAPDTAYSAWPSERLVVTYFLDYDHPAIGTQTASFCIGPEVFTESIAPARTFCTEEEVAYLREHNLIKGGDANNAVVVGRQGIINTELYWENELARHKLLDFLGDLYLLGSPPQGHFVSCRGGHQANAAFTQTLRKAWKEHDR